MKCKIDENLFTTFTPDKIINAYYEYKLAKWDRFSGIDEPEINIPMGADGTKFESFENQIKRQSENIAYRVINNKYIFYPFREVEKLKEPRVLGKPPKYRTLSIASIRDALVQALLYNNILYEPFENIFKDLDSKEVVSFAYRKGKSAPLAAETVFSHLQNGYWFVFDADLSKYFDTIPHDKLLRRVAKVIGGKKSITYNLVRRFIHTEAVPYKTYKNKRIKGKLVRQKIFHIKKPIRQARKKGIPQGGVLSGMLANLYLHDFDSWVINKLGKNIDLKYVRYADDFVILARSSKDLEKIEKRVNRTIGKLGLSINKDKTSKYDMRLRSLDFVGFHFDQKKISVRSKNIDKYKQRILDSITTPPEYVKSTTKLKVTLKWIIRRINNKVQGYSRTEICPLCRNNRIGPPRSWITFFKITTNLSQLQKLDNWTRKTIYDYIYKTHKLRINRSQLRKYGFKSLVNQKFRVSDPKLTPCLCDIERNGLWIFVKDMFQGRKFKTLKQQKNFLVSKVDANSLTLFINNNKYTIPKDTFLKLWEDLTTTRTLNRAKIEKTGIKCTSQIVSLLSQLPGVQTQIRPIQLYFTDLRPANFLIRK